MMMTRAAPAMSPENARAHASNLSLLGGVTNAARQIAMAHKPATARPMLSGVGGITCAPLWLYRGSYFHGRRWNRLED